MKEGEYLALKPGAGKTEIKAVTNDRSMLGLCILFKRIKI